MNKDQSKLNTKLISGMSAILVGLSIWTIHKVSDLGEQMATVRAEIAAFSSIQTNQDAIIGSLDGKQQGLEHRVTVLEATAVRTK